MSLCNQKKPQHLCPSRRSYQGDRRLTDGYISNVTHCFPQRNLRSFLAARSALFHEIQQMMVKLFPSVKIMWVKYLPYVVLLWDWVRLEARYLNLNKIRFFSKMDSYKSPNRQYLADRSILSRMMSATASNSCSGRQRCFVSTSLLSSLTPLSDWLEILLSMYTLFYHLREKTNFPLLGFSQFTPASVK
jgi:hypothetical protein